MESTSFAIQRLAHWAIVACVCHRIRLIEQIDRSVGPPERKVSVGEAMQESGHLS